VLGPPRSIIADSIPVPTEVPLKSSNDADIGDITSDSEVETTTKSKSNAPFNSENPMDDSALKQHENEADWNQSKDNEKQINISSIGLPTWNTFGASNLFAPPQENSSAHANSSWALRNESDGMATKPISWTDASPPALPANEEDEAAALTDASAAVPRDLLSSGPASEEEEAGKEDVNEKINKDKFHSKRNKPYQRKPRPGRHTRPRKNHKPYHRKQSREQAEENVPESSVTADSKQDVDKSRNRTKHFKRRYYNKDNRRPNHSSMDRSSKEEEGNRESSRHTRRPYRPRYTRKPKPQKTQVQPPVETSQ